MARPAAVTGRAVDPSGLRVLAARLKLASLEMVNIEGLGYLGQALSAGDVFAVMFGADFVRFGLDRFILSPGHYATVFYATAHELGLLSDDDVAAYGGDGALLEAISTERTPLVDLTCGSLGQGLSGAIGFALSDRLTGTDRRVVAFLSDGELEEGQVWEAAMFAAHHRLDKITVALDANGSQVDGPIASVTTIEPIADKWRAFGWAAFEVDGHDVEAVAQAFADAEAADQPAIVIARTEIFGRMRSIPDKVDGHFIKLDEVLYAALKTELEEAIANA